MGTLSRLRDFTADRDAVPPVAISAQGMDDEFDQVITESNAQDVRLDTLEAAGNVSTADLADDAVTPTKASFTDDTLVATDTHIMVADGTDFDNVAVSGDATLSNTGVLTLTTNSIVAANITDGEVSTSKLAGDAVDGTRLADNACDSEHYTDGSIDKVHLSADCIDGTKLEDNACDSEHYTDGSIDNAHMSVNSIDSDQYVDGSIDNAHMSANSIDSDQYVDGSIDSAHIGDDQVITSKILNSNVTLPKIVDATATNKVLGRVATGSGNWEEVTLETTLSSTNEAIPTSKAVRDDIVSLVNDVGGFHAVADDQSFPNTNPDPDDGAGTVVSIANAGGLVVNGSGVTTTGRTLGSSTVTINSIPSAYQSTTIADGLGMHVISTVTLNTYTYHKIIAKEGDTNIVATNIANVNTVAGISSNVTTVAGVAANVTTVAGISANTTTVAGIASDVTAVAGDATDIGAVAGKATEIGRLGTAAAVADMAILGETAIVADMAILGDADIVADMAVLGATGVADDMETVANNVASVTTTATNIADVNNFANVYRIASSDPGSDNDFGDMVFNTSTNKTRVYNTSGAWQDVSPTSANDVFGTVAVDGQSNIVADNTAATLNFAGTGGTTITTNAGTDTVTIDTPTAGVSAGFSIAMSIAL